MDKERLARYRDRYIALTTHHHGTLATDCTYSLCCYCCTSPIIPKCIRRRRSEDRPLRTHLSTLGTDHPTKPNQPAYRQRYLAKPAYWAPLFSVPFSHSHRHTPTFARRLLSPLFFPGQTHHTKKRLLTQSSGFFSSSPNYPNLLFTLSYYTAPTSLILFFLLGILGVRPRRLSQWLFKVAAPLSSTFPRAGGFRIFSLSPSLSLSSPSRFLKRFASLGYHP